MKQYSYNIDDARYDVTIESVKDGIAEVNVNGVHFNVEMLSGQIDEAELPTQTGAPATTAAPKAEKAQPQAVAAAPAQPTGTGEGSPVKAPLPGVVTAIKVSVGQSVKKGETVAILEAMKMENNIAAECDGKVTGIAVQAGESVLEGTVLVTIA
ncbi:MAG: biotin/lipoyl-binding protein [Bacteroidaceae bacterium]|nr:biotin/lipoyl-binding protein [Bacteroidaceae bacterium]